MHNATRTEPWYSRKSKRGNSQLFNFTEIPGTLTNYLWLFSLVFFGARGHKTTLYTCHEKSPKKYANWILALCTVQKYASIKRVFVFDYLVGIHRIRKQFELHFPFKNPITRAHDTMGNPWQMCTQDLKLTSIKTTFSLLRNSFSFWNTARLANSHSLSKLCKGLLQGSVITVLEPTTLHPDSRRCFRHYAD